MSPSNGERIIYKVLLILIALGFYEFFHRLAHWSVGASTVAALAIVLIEPLEARRR